MTEQHAVHHNELCAHRGCQCLAPKEEKYCSAWCRDADDVPDSLCACGHSECEDSPQFVG